MWHREDNNMQMSRPSIEWMRFGVLTAVKINIGKNQAVMLLHFKKYFYFLPSSITLSA
jgi:hypothetical protein